MPLPRFRIRTLMIAVAAAAFALVPLSCATALYYTLLGGAFNEAVAPFVTLGATVTATGGDDFGRSAGAAGVSTIRCKDNFGDAELARLSGRLATFPNLRWLILSGPKVTNAGIAHLKGLKNLESLDLRNTRVTDTGIAELKSALPNLKVGRLDISGLK